MGRMGECRASEMRGAEMDGLLMHVGVLGGYVLLDVS